jgi:hypothetical protein
MGTVLKKRMAHLSNGRYVEVNLNFSSPAQPKEKAWLRRFEVQARLTFFHLYLPQGKSNLGSQLHGTGFFRLQM